MRNVEPRSISKEELNKLPLYKFNGPIHLVDTEDTINEAVSTLKQESIIGFDTETRPTFRKGTRYPTSLLQLASSSEVYLFRLTHLGLTPTIADILADEKILKIGVGIRDDIKELQDIHHFEPSNFIDLQKIARKYGLKKTSLRYLSAHFLNVRISKRAQVSPWHKPKLTDHQIRYAATDAWIPREIYLNMLELGIQH